MRRVVNFLEGADPSPAAQLSRYWLDASTGTLCLERGVRLVELPPPRGGPKTVAMVQTGQIS